MDLFISERTVQFLPTLAKVLKSSEKAIILQEVHFWCMHNETANRRSTHFHNGQWWMYAPFEKKDVEADGFSWDTYLSWLSIRHIKRLFQELRDENLLIAENWNTNRSNRTLWYSPNYAKLAELAHSDKIALWECQNSTMIVPKQHYGYTGITTELTTDIKPTVRIADESAATGSDLFGNENPQPGTLEHPDTHKKLNGFLSVSDQVDTLLDRFNATTKPIPFLRASYLQIFGVPDSAAPSYAAVGKLFKKAVAVFDSNEREAGEFIIRIWVQHTLAKKGNGTPENPMDYATDMLNHRAKSRRELAGSRSFQAPTNAQVSEYFTLNGSTSIEAGRFYNLNRARGWAGIVDWKPLADNWIERAGHSAATRSALFTSYKEATDYYEKNRASSTIRFDAFFKPVDERGRDYIANASDFPKKPLWKLIAQPNQMKR